MKTQIGKPPKKTKKVPINRTQNVTTACVHGCLLSNHVCQLLTVITFPMMAAQQLAKHETVNLKVQKKQRTRSCQSNMKRDNCMCVPDPF